MSLKIKNLFKSFEEKTIFRDFTYYFQDTGIYALRGESGIGKTTLLRIIAGLDKKYYGTVSGGGLRHVSFCFQEHRLFPHLSALENVLKLSFSEDSYHNKKLTERLLQRLNFSESDMHLKPDELSGGMRQRVAFARAVLKKSKILLLDEPTKELDASLRDTVLEIIAEEAKERLVIFVTHKPEEIEILGAKVIELNT